MTKLREYTLRGSFQEGILSVPIKLKVIAKNDKWAFKKANEEAYKTYLVEGYSTTLGVFNSSGKQIGIVHQPDPSKRICETCKRKGKTILARFREVYDDLTGTDVCEECILSEESREKWTKDGRLERVFDYQIKSEVDRITLQPL